MDSREAILHTWPISCSKPLHVHFRSRFRDYNTENLTVLHKYSIVHTNLKPDNIMIVDDAVKTIPQANVSLVFYFYCLSYTSIRARRG